MSASSCWGRLMLRLIVGPALRYDMDQTLRESGQGDLDGALPASGLEPDTAMRQRVAAALRRIGHGR